MSIMFKAGKYYIGDLCYVINNDEWDQLLEDTNYFENEKQSYKNEKIFVSETAEGDGLYYDNFGREYCVDAGILGIMPFELISGDGKYGNIIEFKRDFCVEAHEDGSFTFGNITIETAFEDEDNEEDYYDNEEYENYEEEDEE